MLSHSLVTMATDAITVRSYFVGAKATSEAGIRHPQGSRPQHCGTHRRWEKYVAKEFISWVSTHPACPEQCHASHHSRNAGESRAVCLRRSTHQPASLTQCRTDMRRHMMCEIAAAQAHSSQRLRRLGRVDQRLMVGLRTQNRRPSTGLATQTRCSTWSRGIALEKCGP